LFARHEIYSRASKWQACHDIAETLTKIVPGHPDGWISLSIAKYRLGRTQEAYDTLKPCGEQFPKEWRVHYNLACYACQLGNLDEAEALLKEAFIHGNAQELQKLIIEDPDLDPLKHRVGL
jgi:tetratricopeptide (TPR) repeat protein